MNQYSEETIKITLNLIDSLIVNCERVRLKLKEGSSQLTLITNRLKALRISKAVLEREDSDFSNDEIAKAIVQITSIKKKSETGIGSVKEGSAAYTRFKRLIEAMEVILSYLECPRGRN